MQQNEDRRVLAYVRGSLETVDLENQIFAIKEWAIKNNYQLIDIVSDPGTSGWKVEPLKRPKFRELIYIAKEKGIKNLVFYSHDRLARNYFDGIEILKYLKKKEGFNIMFAADEWLSKIEDEALRDMILGILFFVAQKYAESVSDKVQTAIKRIKESEADPLNVFDVGWSKGKLKKKDGSDVQRLITPEVFTRIAQLRRSGFSWQAIADRMGMKKSTVYMAWRRVGERVQKLRADGHTWKEIAEHSGVSVKVLKEVEK